MGAHVCLQQNISLQNARFSQRTFLDRALLSRVLSIRMARSAIRGRARKFTATSSLYDSDLSSSYRLTPFDSYVRAAVRIFFSIHLEIGKICRLNWQGTLSVQNTGKYCLGNNQSYFKISGPRRRISHGHMIDILSPYVFHF